MTDQTYDEATRALAKALFAPDEPDDPEPDEQQKPGNVVPGEGNNPATHTDAADMAQLARALFAPDPDA
jgi:hypothetical protein